MTTPYKKVMSPLTALHGRLTGHSGPGTSSQRLNDASEGINALVHDDGHQQKGGNGGAPPPCGVERKRRAVDKSLIPVKVKIEEFASSAPDCGMVSAF